ncbi:hypothetical protein [Ignatzschineria cameli]|uniref:Uncharacterized protein n=1 Tax=Ignatzschineria cameli TaxID=2182793 RepID=A0ABX5L262_9GAMM|nr:hypothetical protein [Ignatzschineria cameli]PWD90371.1 hypothetical protein DC079_04315 [Ignatzschineria cameli]PWD92254.1 hypothetical protein DC081_04020 [Ignatzschineria cameli]PWD93048.1 hypothetical protein DC078_04315 [Ignatzschineria cameli]
MSAVILTHGDERFTESLWNAANQMPPQFICAILIKITESIEIKEDGTAAITFNKQFQEMNKESSDD